VRVAVWVLGMYLMQCQVEVVSIILLCCQFDVGYENKGNLRCTNVDTICTHPDNKSLDALHVHANLLAHVECVVENRKKLIKDVSGWGPISSVDGCDK
jgi:hypothetical protein